ncbi:hypothetical protein EF902_24630 [Streptomyces sp. WAC05858]|nr:hypothetical protein EF902_24630 [Streptomyces sp. WAC05858]
MRRGATAVRDALIAHQQAGVRHVIADALTGDDLAVLGAAALELPSSPEPRAWPKASGTPTPVPVRPPPSGCPRKGGRPSWPAAARPAPWNRSPASMPPGCPGPVGCGRGRRPGRGNAGRAGPSPGRGRGAPAHRRGRRDLRCRHHRCCPATPPVTALWNPSPSRRLALAEQTARTHHVLLLANHGPVIAAATLERAADAIEELEETAKLYLLLRGHTTRPLTPEQAAAHPPTFP